MSAYHDCNVISDDMQHNQLKKKEERFLRKGQAQILKRAQKDGFSKRKIDFLKNEKMTVEELENSYRFFYFCPDAKVEDYLWMCSNK